MITNQSNGASSVAIVRSSFVMSVLRLAMQAAIGVKKAITLNHNHRSVSMEDARCSTVKNVNNRESRGATNASMDSTSTNFKICARASNVSSTSAKVVPYRA